MAGHVHALAATACEPSSLGYKARDHVRMALGYYSILGYRHKNSSGGGGRGQSVLVDPVGVGLGLGSG